MIDAERQLLGAWLNGQHKEHIKEFEYFTYYSELLRALQESKKINVIAVAKESGMKVADVAQLIAEYLPTAYEGAYRLKKEEKIRAMLQEAVKNPKNIADRLELVITELDKLSVSSISKPTDLCQSYVDELESRKVAQPLKWGLPKLDYVTGGFRRKELTVIAARPSVGKTALALQVALNIALKDNKVLFFPLEMSASQLMERIVCRETDIRHERLKTPKNLDGKDNEKLKDFLELYSAVMKKHLGIIEGVSNLNDIRKHIEHYKPSIVFIDQLSQLKENKRFNSIREQFTYMTNTLKAMTMELNIPIVLLAQINRDAQNNEPNLSNLKESGSIEEDADNIIMIHQTDEAIGEFTPMSIIIRKQRNGARDIFVPTMYRGNRFIFQEIAKEQ